MAEPKIWAAGFRDYDPAIPVSEVFKVYLETDAFFHADACNPHAAIDCGSGDPGQAPAMLRAMEV
jgi:hypothetical protein